MPRSEFSKPTKREALRRSNGLCEAVGELYGLPPGQRCNAPLSHGVDFDHYPIAATEPESDGIENCVAVCKKCHRFKTSTFDVPAQAKSKRVRDKHLGIRNGPKMQGRGFPRRPPQHSASRPIRRKSDQPDNEERE